MRPLHVVLAPNAFKGTLTASEAAEAMRRGVEAALTDSRCVMAPIADGGDGSVDAFIAAGYRGTPVRVRDALGAWHAADIAVHDDHAVVEVANTCGLALLGPGRHPMAASTLGLGDAIRTAVDTGATDITVCLGGSASTDGGAGMLVALGARLLDDAGRELAPCGETLSRVARLDLTELDRRIAAARIDVIADVTSPMHGPAGAAHVFAPQKGASSDEVTVLDDGLRRWAWVLANTTGLNVDALAGSGAAGGTGAALAAVLGARIDSPRTILDLVGLPHAVRDADLVITGEGRLDSSTLAGKGCAAVIDLAHASGIPVIAVCGQIDLEAGALASLGLTASAASADAGAEAARSLVAATERAVATWRS